MRQQKLTTHGKERLDLLDRIDRQNEEADSRYALEQLQGQRELDESREEAEWDAENEQFDREIAAEDDILLGCNDLKERLREDGCGGLFDENGKPIPEFEQTAGYAIRAGAKNDSYETYKGVGDRIMAREKRAEQRAEKLKKGDIDKVRSDREKLYDDHDDREYRETLLGNSYVRIEEPVGEQIGPEFANRHPGLSDRGKNTAADNVDSIQSAQFVANGSSSNDWPIYKKAGDMAEDQEYIKTLNRE